MDQKELSELQKALNARQQDVNKAEVMLQHFLRQIKEQADEVRKWNTQYKTVLKHLICAAKERGANGVLTLTKRGVESVPDTAGVGIEQTPTSFIITPYYGEQNDSQNTDAPADDAGNVLTMPVVEDKKEGGDS